jgi:hypothetical protein
MTKVLTFKVEVEELENKIWRVIEITDSKTVAELAYTILATFDSLAYHLYNIKHGNDRYDCMIAMTMEDYSGAEKLIDANTTKLAKVDFSKNNKMVMEYDYGSTITFIITYISSKNLERGHGRHYPYIIDGQGRGIIDDLSTYELVDIVKDIDKTGKSVHDFTPGYDRPIKYDYRDFDLKGTNILLKGSVEEIKDGYEGYEE